MFVTYLFHTDTQNVSTLPSATQSHQHDNFRQTHTHTHSWRTIWYLFVLNCLYVFFRFHTTRTNKHCHSTDDYENENDEDGDNIEESQEDVLKKCYTNMAEVQRERERQSVQNI